MSFTIAYFIITSIYKNILDDQAIELSEELSKQVFNSMNLLMKRGWSRKELNEFLKTFDDTNKKLPFNIQIFRSELVSSLYGNIDNSKPNTNVLSAMGNGIAASKIEGYNISYIYPIKAQKDCLSCHVNAQEGSILGVMSITQDIKNKIVEAENKVLKFFLILFPIPLIIALIPALYIRKKVAVSAKLFNDKLKEINSVKDLTTLKTSDLNLGFTELNNIFHEVEKFTTKLKDVAIDKEIMEFEIKILEKLMITSDVIRDWKALVSKLLTEMNKVINACALFSIFHVDEGVYDIEVFWRCKPQDSTKESVERVINKLIIKDNQVFNESSTFNVMHNVIDKTIELPEISESDIELQMKTIILENPQVGGVIGVGVQTEISKDSFRILMIEGILTTLISAVGSIKAIYKYTKDLEFYATRDPLTGLYNQRLFWELLGSESAKARRHKGKFVLMIIDFDKFKAINDTHGHKFGDNFLKTYSNAINDQLRQGDILCRYGGDEFTVLLPETQKDRAMIVAERIKNAIENTSMTSPNKDTVNATISIGMAAFPDHGDNGQDIFLIADTMLYKSKETGRNTISVPTEEDIGEIYQKVSEKSLLVLRAIDENLLMPYFQPIVDTATKKILGHELLMRIIADNSVTPAKEFLEYADNMGLMQKLDFILMDRALQKMAAEKYSDTLFVNMTIKGLKISEYILKLMELVNKHRIDPSMIVFEVSEKEIIKNMGLLEKLIIELNFKGFRFAIEGFGRGLTSFQYIKHFPVDYIKIHNLLLKSAASDSVDRAYLRSIITLARELNITIIAEYIENSDDNILAVNEKIECCQGYYSGKPGPEFVKEYCL
ncbi:MAG: bifunctional diguanylate cyclase/phosphodiesterase [Nitrospirae bacterium]|nr:bifunctional diguanylate cyclase/phosphodiesterase [Nitrospirota bacterium]